MGTMRVLKFSYDVAGPLRTGRELLAELNGQVLADLLGERLFAVTVRSREPGAGWRRRLQALAGWLDGLTRERAAECLSVIQQHGIEVVYLEGSNYGRLAGVIRAAAPSCRIVVFFHNVEARFFWGSLRSNPSLKSAAVLFANWIAERCAVRHSDRIICLNERDSALLKRIYGRGATDIHPMCVARPLASAAAGGPVPEEADFGLFVGGAFYANVAGVRWFARHVAARLPCRTYIVGKGFEKYRDELAAFPNVRVIGGVPALEPWYSRSAFVIAPIFDGSGMKTKVAEALMHGRPVIGTSEAFVGYEDVARRAGFVCDNADAFVDAVSAVCSGAFTFDANELKMMYEEFYSCGAMRRRFQETLAQLAKAGS